MRTPTRSAVIDSPTRRPTPGSGLPDDRDDRRRHEHGDRHHQRDGASVHADDPVDGPPDGTTSGGRRLRPSGSITAGAAGTTILLGAGAFTATVTGYNSVGTSVVTASFTCSLQPTTQDLLVDSSRGRARGHHHGDHRAERPDQYRRHPGRHRRGHRGGQGKPDGTVASTYTGKTVTVDVKGGKTKSASLPAALTMGAYSVSAGFTPTDETSPRPTAQRLRWSRPTVRPACPRSTDPRGPDRGPRQGGVGVRHPARRPGEVRAQARRGEDPHQDGHAQQARRGARVFNNIRKSAAYTVVAGYKGSATLKRSNDRFKFV